MSAPLESGPYIRRDKTRTVGSLLPLTKRQDEVVTFMVKFYRENDMLPGMNDICRAFNWSSPNAAQCHVREIERRGYVEINSVGKYKFTAALHERISA